VTARLVGLASVLVIPLGAMLLLAIFASDGFLIGVALLLAVGGVGVWMVRRQVSAITWAELDEELVIRRGRLLRSLVSVPYGRLQYVDVQSGPLSRRLGMARVELHTASPESGGSIPGLPIAEAEALRTRLAARGEAQRAGL
jgi:membrane protein YdbS with pleckstrin-like domain